MPPLNCAAAIACLALNLANASPPRAATVPEPRTDNAITGFIDKHHAHLELTRNRAFDVVFLGDSIAAGWSNAQDVWRRHYGRLRAVNLGIGSSTVQNLLWRLENGMLDNVRARVVVVLIGTNNSAANTARDVAAAIRHAVESIRARVPEVRVLVLGVFPRGPRGRRADGSLRDDGIKRMEMIRSLNRMLPELDDGRSVRFLDIGAAFIDEDGRIPDDLMPDQLHLSAKGYEVWAASMQPLLADMLQVRAAGLRITN